MRRIAFLAFVLALAVGPAVAAEPRHAIAMYGDPKYGPGFRHLDYVNPDALKGGTVRLAEIGTTFHLNAFSVRGVPAAGLGRLYDTLMTSPADEPFTQYGLIAETIEVAENGSAVAFNLRAEARFHDGRQITADDVVFSFEQLTSHHPVWGSYFAGVERAMVEGPRRVRFLFKPGRNRELPLILGQLPVLPKHYWETRDIQATTLDPPLGSGPYRVAAVEPGRAITYERVTEYWAADLPVNRGRHNFGTIRHEYYFDTTVALEAFRAGLYDFRQENIARLWATGYDFPAVATGEVRLEEIPNQVPAGMQGFVFNTRRSFFADAQVRWAIAHAFDFEWTNETLFYGAYERTDSYFENSDLAAAGLPSDAQRRLLAEAPGDVPPRAFDSIYRPPEAEGPHGARRNLLEAQRLLEEAGWVFRDGRRVHKRTGEVLAFEILLVNPGFERVALPFASNLERLAITANVRTVDSAQYQNRLHSFDFDMIVHVWPQSLSPGNEQRDYWSSSAADDPGSGNLAGIRSAAVDYLIEAVVGAPDRESLRDRVAALDRVLLWGHYVVPHWYTGVFRIAYWNRLARPSATPPYGLAFDTWWIAGANAPSGTSRAEGTGARPAR